MDNVKTNKTDNTEPTSQDNKAGVVRNSNDNFNDEQVDDYGIDYSKPGAEEELDARMTIKGGRGPNSGKRNPNDEFNDESEAGNPDEYKA